MPSVKNLSLNKVKHGFLKPLITTGILPVVFLATVFFLLSGCANQLNISKDHQSSKKAAAGLSYYKERKYKQAIETLGEAVKLDPKNTEALKTLGLCYESTGRLADAAASYRQSLKTNPNQYEVLYMIAIIYKSKGNKSAATEQLEKAILVKKDFIGARIVLGDLYAEQNKNEKARKMYQSILNLKPHGTDLEDIKRKMDVLKK